MKALEKLPTVARTYCYTELKVFHLNSREHIVTVRITKHWPRFATELWKSPSLEILRSHLSTILCKVVWMVLLEQKG